MNEVTKPFDQKLSDENEIEDYELDTWNHLQVQGFIKELQWIENNRKVFAEWICFKTRQSAHP